MLDLAPYREAVSRTDTVRVNGRVAQVVGVLVEANGPACGVGEICRIECGRTQGDILAEAVGFRESRVLLMPFGPVSDIRPGCQVIATGSGLRVAVGDSLLGRVLDGLGGPLDGKAPDRCGGRSQRRRGAAASACTAAGSQRVFPWA